MMETVYTSFQSLGGGALIGLAAVFLMATLGRVMGATGILAGLLQPGVLSDWSWRAAVIVGMVSGPAVVLMMTGQMPAIRGPASSTMMIIGGFLFGIGVTFGSDCTSGHGVCGLSRLSPRSIAATLSFMTTSAATVTIIRHGG